MLSTYTIFLTNILTPARLQHSQGVMQVMGELAEIYGLDREVAMTAGLLHDAAKDLSPEEQQRWVREGNIPVQYPCERDYSLYLHGPVGAYFVQKELGITDRLVLDAIATHTWCEAERDNFHHPLSWCLRFSDILEPYRRWDGKAHIVGEGAPRLRELAFAGNLKEAALFHADMIIRFFDENGYPVHPNYYRVLMTSKVFGNL
ncbi:MAG: HD domain-containing protein [Chloroflexi bacterium]|nr:MAG: HD domain-containing protein [Chloroflexota bacterium]